MWDEALTRLVTRELRELDVLLARSSEMLATPKDGTPPFERLAALAQVLTSFYTGLERIFERLAERCDGVSPTGDRWHAELLVQVAQPTPTRRPVISPASHETLREYLAFRHRSRHAYAHHLEWTAMRHLVHQLPDTWARVRTEVEQFVRDQAATGTESG